jgi:hypothetical protein
VEWRVDQSSPLYTEERTLDEDRWTIRITRAGG